MSRIVRLRQVAVNAIRRTLAARRGGVALIFALLVPVLAVCVIGGIDVSQELSARSRLQDATDAAALAVSATDSETPSSTEAQLKTVAGNLLSANFVPYSGSNGTPAITQFSVCTPSQLTDCGSNGVTNTVTISTHVRAPCWAAPIMPGLCTTDGQSQWLTAANTTNIGYPTVVQIDLLLDVSGSMIVGSTPSDVQKMIAWNNTPANWALANDPDGSPPCAFACHYASSSNSVPPTYNSANSDMQQGVINAKKANSITRYDVLIQSASALITHIQNKVATTPSLAKNSYYFNVYAFSDSLSLVYSSTKPNDWAGTSNAINNNIFVGLDSHFSTVMTSFASQIGVNGTGASVASPQKFAILVTDGVQSDFVADFPTNSNPYCGATTDSAWNVSDYDYAKNDPGYKPWIGYTETSCYVSPMPTTACTTIKNNNIIFGVVETPYVGLEGQDPKELYLYETFARHAIYPNGPTRPIDSTEDPSPAGPSAASQALAGCATNGYYFQATSADPTSISTGFVTLTDKFLASNDFLRQ